MDEWAAALAAWPALSGVSPRPVPGYPDVADLGAAGLLKRCRQAEALERELAAVGDLAALGLPVASPRRTAQGAPWVQRPEGRYVWLPRLPGAHLTDLLDRPDHARLTGAAIARVHRAYARLPERPIYRRARMADDLAGRDLPRMARAGCAAAWAPRLTALTARLEAMETLPRQWVHGDMHAENLLFDRGALSGLLDCDKTQHNLRLYDVAYFARCLLMHGWGGPQLLRRWRAAVGSLAEGYGLPPAERAGLGAAVMAVECSLIAYFIQIDHGDYLRGSLELFALMNDANLMDTVL